MQRRRHGWNQGKYRVQDPVYQVDHGPQNAAQEPTGGLLGLAVVLDDDVDLVGRIREQRLEVRGNLGIIGEGPAGDHQYEGEHRGSGGAPGILQWTDWHDA